MVRIHDPDRITVTTDDEGNDYLTVGREGRVWMFEWEVANWMAQTVMEHNKQRVESDSREEDTWEMPPNPKNVDRHEVLSGDYHDDLAHIDFYTNSAIAIGRDRDNPSEGVWLDNLEKRALLETLKAELEGERSSDDSRQAFKGMRMSNSPRHGPLELLRMGWRRWRESRSASNSGVDHD